MTEHEEAIALANRILDRPSDPDDDLALLSRQFLRTLERLALVRKALLLDLGFAEHRLGWLKALLCDLAEQGWWLNQNDPPGAFEAIAECQLLLEGLTLAFRDELDAQVEAERAALGELPGPDDEQLPY